MGTQRMKTVALLKAIISEKLDCDPNSMDEKSAFFNLGVTSLISEEICTALKNHFSDVSETVMFEYPNIRRLSAHLEGKLTGEIDDAVISRIMPVDETAGESAINSIEENTKGDDTGVVARADDLSQKRGYEVAIIGISGRFPQADNPGELWQNLLNNKDCVTEIPEQRWDYMKYFSTDKRDRQALFGKWGGFINGVEEFDPLFFQISHREAESLDPQQKLFLQCCWELMEDAGYGDPENRSTDNIGVYVGVTWNEFSVLAYEEGALDNQYRGAGSLYWGIPNRVSYFLDLKGPSIAIDTACSSSLVAIHDACYSLLTNECEMAIAGGVNLNLHPAKYLYLSQNHFLSSDGKCRSFGAGGDGYVPGEGVAAVLLKPLDKAKRDGDYIYGVIRGSDVNHGGKVTGYTVPNPNAQRDLIASAVSHAGVNPEHISYIECHGTGTELGDPIEINGLSSAFEPLTDKKQFCAVGSLKSNIGHLEAAAGVAGVIKVLQSMRYRLIPGSLHSEEENRKLNLSSTPFYIAKSNLYWQPVNHHDKLIAGVSSFGAGGANAHLIVEEFPAPTGGHADSGQRIFALSAQSPEQLNKYAGRLIECVKAIISDVGLQRVYSLDNVSFTLMHGRKHFARRLAVVADSFETLLEKLKQFKVNGVFEDDVLSDVVEHSMSVNMEVVEHTTGWARRWVSGQVSPQSETGQRIPLPTYPFLKERSWISTRTPLAGNKSGKLIRHGGCLHPLVDSNRSTLHQQKYRKTFGISEYVLEDHLVNEIHVIPGVCHLEMAAVTGMLAAEHPVSAIKDVWFSNVISVEDQRTVEIEFVPKGDVVHYQIRDPQQDILFSRGKVQYSEPNGSEVTPPSPLNIDGIKASLTTSWDSESVYKLFVRTGIIQKTSFQVLKEISFDQQYCLSKLVLPENLRADFNQYKMHPALMDGAVQTAMMYVQFLSGSEVNILPFHFSEVKQYDALTETVYVYCRLVDYANKQFDMTLCNESGDILVEITGFILKEMKQEHVENERNRTIEQSRYSSSYYSPYWEARDTNRATIVESLLLVGDDDEIFKQLKSHSAFKRTRLIRVVHGECYAEDSDDRFVVPRNSPDGYQTVVKRLKDEKRLPDRIVTCGNFFSPVADPDLDTIDNTLNAGVKDLFILCKALIPAARQSTLVYLSRAPHCNPAEQAVSGLLKTLRVEKPSINGRVVHLEGQHSNETLVSIIADELCADDIETDIVYREGRRLVRMFNQAPAGSLAVNNDLLRRNGVYLITGGLGEIGLIFAQHLADVYQARVYLTGRSQLTADKRQLLDQMAAGQGDINYLACDVGYYDEVKKLVQTIVDETGELHGVFHSAGIIDDAFMLKKTPESFSSVIKPKVNGTLNLDNATQDLALDLFVTFSSVTSILGNFGQCDYGFGNAFEDYYAYYRQALVEQGKRQGKSLSINWPYWKNGGMQLNRKEEEMLTKTFGFVPLTSEHGVQALIDGLRSELTQFAVLPAGDIGRIEQVLGINAEARTDRMPVNADKHAISDTADGHNADNVFRQVEAYLKQLFAKELKIPVERINGTTSFDQYGMDSIVMIDLITVMEEKFSSLPKTLFFEHHTLEELAHYFQENYADHFNTPQRSEMPVEPEPLQRGNDTDETALNTRFSSSNRQQSAAQPATMDYHEATTVKTRRNDDEIAIIGLSGRYPQADTLDEFWQNLKAGRDCITEIPADRWDLKQTYQPGKPAQGKSYSKWGGFLQDVDQFDPLFFNISPGEAENMDPQERLFLETVAATIEDAGYTADTLTQGADLAENPVGVFAGLMWGDYQLFGVESDDPARWVNPRSFYWAVANRVSYYFNFSGPSIAIDTACSSSLTALHLACDSLRKGECSVAVAGGVNLSLHPNKYNLLSNMQFLSSDGRCRSFGEGGDGYVPGEGVGAVLLKPLQQAVADGDHIYAVVKGSTINHGGKTSGFTVPNPKRQSQLIGDALRVSGVNPRHISYLEAHGTGTSLGDPVEMIGLNKAFAQDDRQYCAIGSLKSNIGHLEAAAGIAGLTKVLLQFKHKTLVPSLHASEINQNIDFTSSPFYLQKELQEWKRPVFLNEEGRGIEVPRIAGISSFGAGGSNAHVIIEEYIEPEQQDNKSAGGPSLILLSAEKEESLEAYAESLQAFCDSTTAFNLEDVAYTLQIGRVPMEYRLAILCSDRSELSGKLDAYLKGHSNIDGLLAGSLADHTAITRLLVNDSDSKEVIEKWIQNKNYMNLASLWIGGVSVNWLELHCDAARKRVSLPTYPYKKERYWITKPASTRGYLALHPLLDSNISNLREIAFSKTLSNSDFYIRDHQLGKTGVMPASAYLEMASQAGTIACGENVTVLRNILWTKPLLIKEQPKTVTIGLYPDADSVYFEVSHQDREHKEAYCQGMLETSMDYVQGDEYLINIDAVKSKTKLLNKQQIQDFFSGLGFRFGPSFEVFREFYRGEREALAFLELPEDPGSPGGPFILHPALVDGVLRATVGIGGTEGYNRRLPLPVALERLEILGPVDSNCCVYVSLSKEDSVSSQVRHFDITVMNGEGGVLARLRNFMTRLVETSAGVAADNIVPKSKETKTDTDPARLFETAQRYLKHIVSQVLKLPVEQLESNRALEEYGIDSTMIVSLNDTLEQTFGPLSKTLFFEYQDLAGLAGYFVEDYADKVAALSDGNDRVKVEANVTAPEPASLESAMYDAIGFSPIDVDQLRQPHNRQFKKQDEIAIVGISGRYPKSANLDEFYENLRRGRNCVSEIPADRWDGDSYYDPDRKRFGKSYSKWGGFLDRIDQFDPLFFNITPAEVVTIDPQERLFLETVWETLENAGYTKSSLSESTVGVFAGAMWGHYELLGVQEGGGINQKLPGSNFSSIANRVSYYFNFRGPSISLDTMCSSSLTAIHLACESIKRGECDVAIAGGVNLNIHPHKYLQLSGFQFLSTDGTCRSFGEGGDGYVPGEGVGAIMLKSLRQAEADGDFIYGVIKATSINHGGKANGFYVPNPNAQGELIKQVLSDNNIKPEQLSYIEAHGTGTALGDPIEITGLKQALSSGKQSSPSCSIGSVKSNIGHLEAAAGIAGITKILLQMNHRELFPSLHSETLNPNLDFNDAPFYVQQKLQRWDIGADNAADIRLAGINSFGAGGSNAFIVLQEYNKGPSAVTEEPVQRLIPLSARTPNALKQYTKRLADFISAKSGGLQNYGLSLTLVDLAFTLQTGREAMQERVAIVADTLDELRKKLEQFSKGSQDVDGVYTGSISTTGMAPASAGNATNGSAGDDLHQLAESWAKGVAIDFNLLHQPGRSRKIPLPNYCFQRKRYWFTSSNKDNSTKINRQIGGKLPLIDNADNPTNLVSGAVFSKTLRPSDTLVSSHRFQGQSLFPGVAYLEMVAEALNSCGQTGRLIFRNIVWQAPLFVKEPGTEIFLSFKQQKDAIGFEIWTLENQQRITHGKGLVFTRTQGYNDEYADIKPFNGDTVTSIDSNALYAQFSELNITYGKEFQAINHVRVSNRHAIARYVLPEVLNGGRNYLNHPAALDSALQTFLVLPSINSTNDMQFPFAVDSVEFIKRLENHGYVKVSAGSDNRYHARILDDNGLICVKFDDVKFRSIPKSKAPDRVQKYTSSTGSFSSTKAAGESHVFEVLERHITALFSRMLEIEPQDLKSDVTFDQYGLESVMAVDLTAALEKDFGTLPATLLFEYQTINSLCNYFMVQFRDICIEKFTPALSITQDRSGEVPHRSEDLKSRIGQYTKEIFSDFLQIDLDELNTQVTFETYGLESVMAVDITGRLEQEFGSLPATLLFEYQTIDSLVEYFVIEHASACESLFVQDQKPVDTSAGQSVESLEQTAATNSIENRNAFEFEDGTDIRVAVNALSDEEVERLLGRLTEIA